jgi:hypothetical protein
MFLSPYHRTVDWRLHASGAKFTGDVHQRPDSNVTATGSNMTANISFPPHARLVACVWNVMAHAQKPDFVFRRNGRVNLNQRGRQFSRLLAVDVCASAVVMLDTPCSEVVWRVMATQSIRQFPVHFPSRASPCAITFQLDSTGTYFSTKHMNSTPRLARSKPHVQLVVRGTDVTVETADSDRAVILLCITYNKVKLSCPLREGTRGSRGIVLPIFTLDTR